MSSIIVEYLHILRTVPSAVAILYQVALVYVRVVAGWFLLPPPRPALGQAVCGWGDVNGPRKPRWGCRLATSTYRRGVGHVRLSGMIGSSRLVIDPMLRHLFLCLLVVISLRHWHPSLISQLEPAGAT